MDPGSDGKNAEMASALCPGRRQGSHCRPARLGGRLTEDVEPSPPGIVLRAGSSPLLARGVCEGRPLPAPPDTVALGSWPAYAVVTAFSHMKAVAVAVTDGPPSVRIALTQSPVPRGSSPWQCRLPGGPCSSEQVQHRSGEQGWPRTCVLVTAKFGPRLWSTTWVWVSNSRPGFLVPLRGSMADPGSVHGAICRFKWPR